MDFEHLFLIKAELPKEFGLGRPSSSVRTNSQCSVQGGPAPDPWREGSTNSNRKINENKLLSRKTFVPSQSKCKTCKTTLLDPTATYCQGCAYQKGICHVCGKTSLPCCSDSYESEQLSPGAADLVSGFAFMQAQGTAHSPLVCRCADSRHCRIQAVSKIKRRVDATHHCLVAQASSRPRSLPDGQC